MTELLIFFHWKIPRIIMSCSREYDRASVGMSQQLATRSPFDGSRTGNMSLHQHITALAYYTGGILPKHAAQPKQKSMDLKMT